MFSSLEALDSEDTLNAAPVARQGAFQPKAKPRARKGAPLPAKRASISSTDAAPKAGSDSASKPDNAINETAENPSNVPPVTQAGVHVEAEAGGGEAKLRHNKPPSAVSSNSPGNVALETEPSKDANVTGVAHGAVKVAMQAITLLKENMQLQGVDGNSQSGAQGQAVLNTQDASSTGYEQQPLSLATQASKDLVHASLDQLTAKSLLQHESDVLGLSITHGFQSYASEPFEPMQADVPLSHAYDADDREVFLSTMGSSNQDPEREIVISLEELIASDTSEYASGKERAHMPNQDAKNLENMGAQESSLQTAVVDPLLETSIEKLAKVKDTAEMKGGQAKKGEEMSPSRADANKPKVRSKTKKTKAATFAADGPSKSVGGIIIASGAEESIEEGAMVEGPGKPEKKARSEAKEPNKAGSRLRKSEAKPKATATAGGSRALVKEVADEVDGAQEDGGEAVVANTEQQRERKKRMRMEAWEQQENRRDALLDMTMPCSQLKNVASPALTRDDASKRKRTMPARYADTTASVVLQALTELEDEAIPMTIDASESMKKKMRGQAKEIDKLKRSKLVDLSLATGAIASKLPPELLDANGTIEPVQPADKGEKKKFKKFVERRKRVDRRTMVNPADPDLDPKKMTMMDIIRLAEAKDRMLRKGDAKKSKDGKGAKSSNAAEENDSPELTCMAPQVQVIDGRLVINQESLTVQAHPRDDVRAYKRVEETHSKLNYHTYMKRTPKQAWRKEETELFYQALREFGTNFAMIQHLFTGRTRKQVFLKFKKEEKCCPLRVAEALRLRPCEYSHHIEILSSMNLLPSETSDSRQDFSPYETTFTREEEEDVACSIADVDRLIASKGGDGDGNGGDSKAEECPTQSDIVEDRDADFQAHEVVDYKECERQESPPKPEETGKSPFESPKKLLSPPRKRSLFSYQMSTNKS